MKNTASVEYKGAAKVEAGIKDKLSIWDKLRHKFVNRYFWVRFIVAIFKYLLLFGLCFLILYPLFIRFITSIMSADDFRDAMVNFIPRNPTLYNFRRVIQHSNYWQALLNTIFISMMAGGIQMFICAMVGYGLARFKFKGRRLVTALVVVTIMVPPQAFMASLFLRMRFFDIYGIIGFFGSRIVEDFEINLLNTPMPIVILSATGFAFMNGIFIYIMRQFFKGMPDELEEAAYVDGAGPLRTFFKVMLPLSTAMMATIAILAFAWQWTDTLYSPMFFPTFANFPVLSQAALRGFQGMVVTGFMDGLAGGQDLLAAFGNAMTLLIIVPLLFIYLFAQRSLVEGIERAGIVG